MSTDDLPKNAGIEDLEDLLDPVVIIRKEQGRFRCSCGRVYSREIVVIACDARGHRPLADKEF